MTDDVPRPASPPPSAPPPAAKAKAKRTFTAGQVLGGILLVLIIVFIVENSDDVKVRLIAGPKVTAPLFVALLIAAVVGALIAALLSYRHQRKSK